MMVGGGKIGGVPGLEAAGEKEVQLHMHMGAALVDAAAGVAEDAQRGARLHLLPGADAGRCEVCVEGVVGAAAPVVPHHDVAAVVALACRGGHVHHGAVGDGPHLVLRVSFGIALQGLDVETLVKASVGDAAADAAGIAHKAELAALPGGGFGAFEVAVNELEEVRRRVKQCVVGGGQLKLLGLQLPCEQA